MYMGSHRWYLVVFFIYVFVEFCFSVFEFTYYGMNTFVSINNLIHYCSKSLVMVKFK